MSELIDSAAAINPLLILGAFALAYWCVVTLRLHWANLLMGLLAAFCAVLLLSPGGRALAERTSLMPERLQRIDCLVHGVAGGALWSEGAVARTPQCSYRGSGFPASTDPTEAARLLRR